jgi:hypothetical protein
MRLFVDSESEGILEWHLQLKETLRTPAAEIRSAPAGEFPIERGMSPLSIHGGSPVKKLLALALLLGALFSAACASSRQSSPNPRPDPLDGFASQRATRR